MIFFSSLNQAIYNSPLDFTYCFFRILRSAIDEILGASRAFPEHVCMAFLILWYTQEFFLKPLLPHIYSIPNSSFPGFSVCVLLVPIIVPCPKPLHQLNDFSKRHSSLGMLRVGRNQGKPLCWSFRLLPDRLKPTVQFFVNKICVTSSSIRSTGCHPHSHC